MSVTTRLFTMADAPVMAALLRENREFLKPTDPVRSDEYFTDEGQLQVIAETLRQWENGFTPRRRGIFASQAAGRTICCSSASPRIRQRLSAGG